MKWETAREIFGVVVVVASLVFVGIEIRQNTSAARGQTRQELAALNQEWLILLSADAEFSELFSRAWMRGEEIAPEEEARAEMMMVLNFRRLENVFFQYQEGLVDESALGSYGLQVKSELIELPRFRAWWSRWRNSLHPDFVEFIESQSD
ncbi:MAG: hypothetical protein NWQ45_12735 [Congregibacter sp.]|nr:hypothetical protein [Congregibacter sp.]